jgi:hypothetical protein
VPKGRRTLAPHVIAIGLIAVVAALVVWLNRPSERPILMDSRVQLAAIGEETSDAEFSFVVLDGMCGYVNVVSPQVVLPAKGTICLVTANVTNRGDVPRSVDPSCQIFVDTSGTRFHQREEAWRLDEASLEAFARLIPPGGVVENVGFYYDTPEGTEAGATELHGACGTRGIRVEL